jgi:hypothetical protein
MRSASALLRLLPITGAFRSRLSAPNSGKADLYRARRTPLPADGRPQWHVRDAADEPG